MRRANNMDPKRVLFASLQGTESALRKSSSGPRREQRLVKILFENSGGADMSSKRSNSPAAVTPHTLAPDLFSLVEAPIKSATERCAQEREASAFLSIFQGGVVSLLATIEKQWRVGAWHQIGLSAHKKRPIYAPAAVYSAKRR